MRSVFLILSVSSFVLGQTTPDQTEGRPKYQRALTDLVPANLITVLDKYHRPITNNYEPPEPTKQKLTKAEILAKFTSAQSSSTTPSTTSTTTTTTTRKPSTFVTSYPTAGQTDDATETPFRILFIQTTTPSGPGTVDNTQPGFFTKVVTQTAKTVTVFEDGVARTETVTSAPSQGTTSPDFSPIFIYKNQRFTSDNPNPVVSVASSVSTSDGEVFKNDEEIKAQTLQGLQNAPTTPLKSSSTPRPRRKVVKVKSRKVLKSEKESRKTTQKPSPETETTTEKPKKKEPLSGRGSKSNVQRERPKVLITRRLTNPQKSQSIELPTTPIPTAEVTTETPKKIRRPGGLRRPTATPQPEKPTTEAPLTTAAPVRPLFRTRVAVTPSRAPTTPIPTQRSALSASTPTQFEPTKPPPRRSTQLTRTSPATSSSTLSNTRLPETPTTLAQTSAVTEAKSSTQRLSQKRVVTRIGTSRPVKSSPTQTTPLPEAPTATPVTTEAPVASRSPKKVVKRKKKPAVSTSTPDSVTSDRTTVTPVSIIYFQTTRFTTPAPPVTEAKRVPKKRRRKPSTPAGTVSTQPIPFSPTEPSTFSAPQAVTGFRPITTSNYFATPEHLQHLPKTDEIAQVINLPGGRLSSYQARYSPQRPQGSFISNQEYDAPLPNPLPQQVPRIPPNQRAIRPGPFTVEEFFANDPSYQDLQRLLVAETNRFHSQPRNSARFSPYQDRTVDYRSSSK